MKELFQSARGKCAAVGAAVSAASLPLAVWATPSLTVPDVDTTSLYSAGNKILVAVGIFIAIAMGLRLFKKG